MIDLRLIIKLQYAPETEHCAVDKDCISEMTVQMDLFLARQSYLYSICKTKTAEIFYEIMFT
jgi:hypothetical protein